MFCHSPGGIQDQDFPAGIRKEIHCPVFILEKPFFSFQGIEERNIRAVKDLILKKIIYRAIITEKPDPAKWIFLDTVYNGSRKTIFNGKRSKISPVKFYRAIGWAKPDKFLTILEYRRDCTCWKTIGISIMTDKGILSRKIRGDQQKQGEEELLNGFQKH